MTNPKTPEKPKRLADRLKAKYDTSSLEDTTTITLQDKTVLQCRRIKSADDVTRLEQRAAFIQKFCERGATDEYKPFLPLSAGVIRYCVYAEMLLVGDDAMTLVEAFDLAKHGGFIMADIGSELVMVAMNQRVESENEAVTDIKNV